MVSFSVGFLTLISLWQTCHAIDSASTSTCQPFVDPSLHGGSLFVAGPAPSTGGITDLMTQPLNVILSATSAWPGGAGSGADQQDYLVQYLTALGLTVECFTDSRQQQQLQPTANLGDELGARHGDIFFREALLNDDHGCDKAENGGLKVKAWRQSQPDSSGCTKPAWFLSIASFDKLGKHNFQSYEAGRDEFLKKVQTGGKDLINIDWPPATVQRIFTSDGTPIALVTVPAPISPPATQ